VVLAIGLLTVVYGGQLLVEHGAEWRASLDALLGG